MLPPFYVFLLWKSLSWLILFVCQTEGYWYQQCNLPSCRLINKKYTIFILFQTDRELNFDVETAIKVPTSQSVKIHIHVHSTLIFLWKWPEIRIRVTHRNIKIIVIVLRSSKGVFLVFIVIFITSTLFAHKVPPQLNENHVKRVVTDDSISSRGCNTGLLESVGLMRMLTSRWLYCWSLPSIALRFPGSCKRTPARPTVFRLPSLSEAH